MLKNQTPGTWAISPAPFLYFLAPWHCKDSLVSLWVPEPLEHTPRSTWTAGALSVPDTPRASSPSVFMPVSTVSWAENQEWYVSYASCHQCVSSGIVGASGVCTSDFCHWLPSYLAIPLDSEDIYMEISKNFKVSNIVTGFKVIAIPKDDL